MKRMRVFLLLVVLTALWGCTPDAPVAEPVPETPVPEAPVESSEPPDMAEWFYVFENEKLEKPRRAVAPDGTVLVATSREIEPLIDEATGEYAAILVRTDQDGLSTPTYDIYAMDGSVITMNVAAERISLFGQLAMVETSTVSLYDRETWACLESDLDDGRIWGDCLWIQPRVYEMENWFYDAAGEKTVVGLAVEEQAVLPDGRACFPVCDSDGNHGLVDSGGQFLVPCVYPERVRVFDGYACVMGEEYEVLDLETGQTVFTCPWLVRGLYDRTALVWTGEQEALISREQERLYASDSMEPWDLDGDGQPEYYLCGRVQGFADSCVAPDGTVLVEQADGTLHPVDSATVMRWNEKERRGVFYDLQTGAERELTGFPGLERVTPVLEKSCPGLFHVWQNVNFFDETLPEAISYDLVGKDGTVILPNVVAYFAPQGPERDVFLCRSGAYLGLRRLDGTWIYLPNQ